MATSGTVSTTVFKTRKVIDHAYRRCRLSPEQVTSQHIQTALDMLFVFLSTLSNKGVALWAIQKHIIPLYENTLEVPCPVGTVDSLDVNLRTLQRPEGTNSASEGNADNAFDGDYDTACTQTIAAGYIQVAYTDVTPVSSFGILPNATGTWDLSLQRSDDGITFTSFYTDAAFVAVDGEWQWIDVDGLADSQYIRLKANGATILNVTEFYVGNQPQEITLAKINRDDYVNLPNKVLIGRPVQFWYDKQRAQPIMRIWNVPNHFYSFSQIILWSQRYVQDIGAMTDELDIPQGWYLAIITNLAALLAPETKECPMELIPDLNAEAQKRLNDAWGGQTDSSKTFWRPNISGYTK